jgi:hypothetical protein
LLCFAPPPAQDTAARRTPRQVLIVTLIRALIPAAISLDLYGENRQGAGHEDRKSRRHHYRLHYYRGLT